MTFAPRDITFHFVVIETTVSTIMASVMDDREDSILDVHRTSLLEIIEDKNRALNKKSIIHRMVFVSKLTSENIDRNEVGNHYDKLLKNLQNVHQSEPITGLLLIYLKHLVHVIETSSDMLTKIAMDLQESAENEDGYVCKTKILNISHDIPQRLYQQWSFRQLDIQAHRLEAYDPSESTDKLVVDLLTQLLKLGMFLVKQPKLNLKNIMDSLHEKVPELLPQQTVMHYLLGETDSCMMLPMEYLKIYNQPYDIVLDSEMTWPLPTKLFPYN